MPEHLDYAALKPEAYNRLSSWLLAVCISECARAGCAGHLELVVVSQRMAVRHYLLHPRYWRYNDELCETLTLRNSNEFF